MNERISTALIVVLTFLAQAGATWSQSWEVGYDAASGSLPTAQGWTHIVSDPSPFDSLDEGNYLVSLGALTQGDTGGVNADPANSQWVELPLSEIDFDAEVLEVEFRLRILTSTGYTPANVVSPFKPDAGFAVTTALDLMHLRELLAAPAD